MFKLKEMRIYEGLTQKEVAEILGVSRSTYAGWESEKDFIPLPRLNQLANLYHTSLDYLVGNSPDMEVVQESSFISQTTFSENLKRFRKEHHLTQEDLARKIHASQSSIHKYENKKALITTFYALEFSKTYKYSIDKLVGRNKNN